MPWVKKWVFLLPLPALAGLPASSGPYWLGAHEYGEVEVVVAEAASPSEHYAAREFQRYWALCTGHEPPIRDVATPGVTTVWIGRLGMRLAERLKLDGLGDDGFHLRTAVFEQEPKVPYLTFRHKTRFPLQARHLLIAGGSQRGTLYGVHQFFHDYFGVRWLTPETTHVPPAPEGVPEINYRYAPPIPYRDTNYWVFTRHPEFAVAHRLNGNSVAAIPEEMGGFMGYAGGFCHTFYGLVDPDKYFETHPEYFSEVNGKRMRQSQLCLTNPEVVRIATNSVREHLRNNPPNRRIVSVTQMDWPFWCECADCAAVDAREGSQAGTMIRFVNAIAEAIADEFPEAFIDTFAYTYTRKPPKHARPRDNVIVRLCSIECDFARPLGDRSSADNRAFQEDIRRWRRIAKHLYIWDYTQNWHAFQGPHPNFQVLQPNVKFFVDNGVSGVFEQAAHSPGADFEYLKAYILAQALWNPEVDWRALYDEFLALYYREAAPFIREYHRLITDKVFADDYVLGIFTKMEWMDHTTVERAEAVFQRAFAAVTDPEIVERLRRAHLPVQYAALVCPPEIEIAEDHYVLRRPPSLSFDEYWGVLAGHGVTHLGDPDIEAFRERLEGRTPPRYQEIPFARLENKRYEVWVVPEVGGSVVRFRDKERDHELLRGYAALSAGNGMIQDWRIMDADAPEIERRVADRYETVAQAENSVFVRAALANGLVVSRQVSLDDEGLRVTLEVSNHGGELVAPRVKLHPEFTYEGKNLPEIWIERDGIWARQPLRFVTGDTVAFDRIEASGVTRWGLRLPGKKGFLVNEVDADQLEALFYFCNRATGMVNLELYPSQAPLEPGESCVVATGYRVENRHKPPNPSHKTP
ncbi:MAG TPA: DUF4838 domain-containing protein [Candidatus Hydrogenedentes bacterium]|nr:DUF4838 domain-containing protein [Candidatus Hydrogenedentota bacterium]